VPWRVVRSAPGPAFSPKGTHLERHLPGARRAAHIRWHQAGGPDEEGNERALCVRHHKLFDLGAFKVGRDGRLLVSDQANGTAGLEKALTRHHGVRVRPAQRPEWRPRAAFLDWHGREVFKGADRHGV
jgi:putative restriction endonuclease